jgi:hypothetical protein
MNSGVRSLSRCAAKSPQRAIRAKGRMRAKRDTNSHGKQRQNRQDGASGKLIVSINHQDEVLRAAFSADGSPCLRQAKTAKLWDAAFGKPISSIVHQDTVEKTAFSSNDITPLLHIVLAGFETGSQRADFLSLTRVLKSSAVSRRAGMAPFRLCWSSDRLTAPGVFLLVSFHWGGTLGKTITIPFMPRSS